MKCQITVLSILIGFITAVPISRQLGGISSDVHVRTINGTQMCQLDGQLYQVDEDLPTEDPCEYCTCQPPGFACQVVKCEHKPECRALQRSGLCCPEYICDCEFNGKIYQNGERITDNENKCEDCYCVTGEVVCSVIQCATPPENCEVVPSANRCCPSYQCPENVADDHQDESTKKISLMDDATILETPKLTESIGTVPSHFDKEETATEKIQVDLDGNENEYWLSLLATEPSSDNFKIKDSSNIDITKPFSEITEIPKISYSVDSVRINMEEDTETPTEDRNENISSIDWTERNAEEFVMSTSVPDDGLKFQKDDVEVSTESIETRILDIKTYEATDRNAEEFEMSTVNPYKELLNELHEEIHATIIERNEDATLATSEDQSFDGDMVEVTMRSVEEEADMSILSLPKVKEDVHKIAKIKFNINDLLKSPEENYVTVRTTVIEDSEMEKLNEITISSSGDSERFEVTERSVEETSTSSIDLVRESGNVNKQDEEFVLSSEGEILESVEHTTTETETRIGDRPSEKGVTVQNADEESTSTVVNKIAKINLSEKDLPKSQNEIGESSLSDLQSFDGEAEEFEATERSGDNFSMTTLQPKTIQVQALKLADTVTEITDKIENSLSNLKIFEATERTAEEELSTSKPSLNEEENVDRLAKIETNNNNLVYEDVTTDEIESSIHYKDSVVVTTEFFEPRTETFLELDGEILEFGIKGVREEGESFTTPESSLYESDKVDEVKKASKIHVPQETSSIVKSEVVIAKTNNSTTLSDESINSEQKENEVPSIVDATKTDQAENNVDDKLEYWVNMDKKNEHPIEVNELTDKNDAESTTIKDEENFVIKEYELKSVQNSEVELKSDVGAATTEHTETGERNETPVKEFSEVEIKAAFELEAQRPKKQRTHLHAHLSKKFGLRPLTRRTFSNDIEKRRITRLRDRKMIVNRNRQNLFH